MLICDDVWRRVYPGAGFERSTDADGKIDFAVWFGSELGNWWLNGRETHDPTSVTGVLRVAQVGGVIQPDNEQIVANLSGGGFFGVGSEAPLSAPTLGAEQENLLSWLLNFRADQAGGGSGSQSPLGDFGPIHSADGSQGAIVFYPAGSPGPLRAHLETGAPLPAGYQTRVIAFKRVVILGITKWSAQLASEPEGLMSLQAWEGQSGPARAGYASARSGGELPSFGGPYPPPASAADARAAFDRCAPGASPRSTVIQLHSPVRLLLRDAQGQRFGYAATGKLVNDLGGYLLAARGGQPASYVLPTGSYTATLTGTARGRATLVVSTPATRGDRLSVFNFKTRKGASGKLALSARGAAGSMRFGGRRVVAANGISLRLSGVPRRVVAGHSGSVKLRVRDQFGRRLAGALTTIRGKGVDAHALTDARGTGRLLFTVPRSGTLRLAVTAPGHLSITRRLAVQRKR